MTTIRVNGRDVEVPPGATVADLLADRGLLGSPVAVAVDGEVVPRSEHAGKVLVPGARVEILRAVGGG